MNNKLTKKIVSTLLLVLLLFLTACNGTYYSDGSWFRVHRDAPHVVKPETPGKMTSQELIQTLILAVNDQTPVGSAFESIPLRQRETVTLSAFTKYVSLIRRGVMQPITSFSVVSQETRDALTEQISAQSDASAELAAISQFYHLTFLDETRREASFIVAIQVDADGLPYMSGEWISTTLRLYDFLELYFSAIGTGDVLALKALLQQGEASTPTVTMDKALENKSQETINFYFRRVITAAIDYKLISLIPGYASVEHYASISLGSGRRENRVVTFTDVNGQILVSDKVPSELKSEDLDVYQDGIKLFRIGSEEQQTDSKKLEATLGMALQHNNKNCRTVNGQANFNFRYRGITLSGQGTCDEHEHWAGMIYSAGISYSDFALGSGLKVGMPVSELYLRYPFARESNYLIAGNIDGKNVSLAAQIEQGYITKLTINMVP